MSENGTPNQNSSEYSERSSDYLSKAVEACAAGNLVLGMHLYLAAYEKAIADQSTPDDRALTSLREAWNLACDLKERSMAEYVFEKLEPYLTGEEIAACAAMLQNLALDRLEEYGFSREELEDMAEMISQDLVEGGASIVKVESISIPRAGLLGPTHIQLNDDAQLAAVRDSLGNAGNDVHADGSGFPPQDEGGMADGGSHFPSDAPRPSERVFESHVDTEPGKPRKNPAHIGMGLAQTDDFNPYDMYRDYSFGKSYHSCTNEGSGAAVFSRDDDRAEASARFQADGEGDHDAEGPATAPAESGSASEAAAETPDAGAQAGTAPVEPELTMANVIAAARQQAAAADPAAQVREDGATGAGNASNLAKRGAGHLQATSKRETPLAPSAPSAADRRNAPLTYDTLVGYDEVVNVMREIGVGLQNDQGYLDFVAMLNEQHGLSNPPALDTLVFRAPAVEDASRFVEATAGELGLPVLRMTMEEGMQGVPVLVVMTQGNHRPRMNHAQNKFEAPAVLVIDDLDSWVMPAPPENGEGIGNFIMANISRGAREAVNLIRSSVEDPNVFVLATATTSGEADPFFYDLLEPLTVIDIGYPNEKERADIWAEIADEHPSMRALDREALVRLSGGMPRYDLYAAAREAIDEAYKAGLMSREYVPVSPQNIFEKLASCLPLGSDEYRALEDEVIRNFMLDLEHLDELADGGLE